MLTFRYFGADGIMTVPEKLTTRMVGAQVKLEFTSEWEVLDKTAVFSAGDVSVSVHAVGETVEIPREVLLVPMQRLYVGIYGERSDGALIIPTIYAKGPIIERGADPYNCAAGDPPPPKWKELEERIDALENAAPDTSLEGNPLIGTTEDITPTEVKEAIEAGRDVILSHTEDGYGRMVVNSFAVSDQLNAVVSTEVLSLAGNYVNVQTYLCGDLSTNTWSFSTTWLVNHNDIADGIKNPSALTIGDVTYDGSVPVEIPASYSKSEIDAIMGAYINDIDSLIGGDS